MSINHILLICVLFCTVLVSCRDKGEKSNGKKLTQEQLIDINRELAIKERERIQSYITRKGLLMEQSEQGFWYAELKEGGADKLRGNTKIQLEYSCSMLDGTICYSSDNEGLMSVIIGKSDIPSGLDTALRLFGDGSEAIIILPSNLAYGLLGDGKRIPSRAALIYHIKVSVY